MGDPASLRSRIQHVLDTKGIELTVEQKDQLLLARFEGVSFYCSLLKDKSELKDWFRMAKDFELSVNKKPVKRADLQNQYAKIQSGDIRYRETHFSIAWAIFDELDRLGLETYAFH